MSIRIFTAVVLGVCCCGLSQAYATDMTGKVELPTLNIGDSWSYRYTDKWAEKPGGITAQEVVSVNENEITLAVKRITDGQTLRKLRWSNQLNPISRGHMQFEPSYPRYLFPLEPGKTWKQEVTGQNPANGKSWRYEVNGKVIGWEKIKVAAGEFDALRVDVEAYYSGRDAWGTNGTGHSVETVWYAPSVKSYVKLDYHDTDWRGKVFNRDSLELTAFKTK